MIRPFNIDKLREVIRTAFAGVGLDGGASLRQLEVMDNYGEDSSGRQLTAKEFRSLYERDESKNWQAIPAYEIRDYVWFAHADAKSFRFYIPAFLLNWLAEGTNENAYYALCPDEYNDYTLNQYALLDGRQRTSIAIFLEYLPLYVELDVSEQQMVKRALDNYWGQFLPPQMKLDD